MTDVRYRLSAEGVAEVVAAFRKIQTEAQRSTGGVQKSFGGFGASLQSITGLLTGVAAAIGGIGLLRLVKEASAAGQEIENLHKRFSSTAEDLSALGVLAEKTGTSLSELSRPLTKLFSDTAAASKNLSGPIADNFRAIGLSTREIRDFAKQDLAGRLETIAKALQKFPDGPERANAAIGILGVRGAALVPILDEIGKKGFGGLREDADKLSALLSEEMVRALSAVNQSLDDVKVQAMGLAAQFVSGLAPALTGALSGATFELTAGARGWRDFGEVVGSVVGFVISSIAAMADMIYTSFTTLGKSLAFLGKAAAAASKGDFQTARVEIESIGLAWQKAAEDLSKRSEVVFGRLKNGPPEGPRSFGPTSAEAAEAIADARAAAEASTKARLAARKAGIDAELALAKAGLKLRENDEEAFFRDGITSLRQFYDSRRRIVADGINAEIVALQKQRIVAGQDKDKGIAEIAKIDGQIAKLALDRQDQLDALNTKEITDFRALAQEHLALDQSVFEARGQQHAARLFQINEEIQKADELLAKQGGSQADNAAALRNLQSALSSAAEFDRVSREANITLADFGRDRAEIERRAGAGLLSQAEAETQILDLERARIDSLRAIADELLKAAEINGDPDKIARAQDFAASVDQVSVALEHQDESLRQLASGGLDIAQNALADFLGTGISQAPTFAAAMRSMAASVVASLQRLLAQFIALKIVTGLTRLFGSAAASSAAGIENQASDVFIGADGGVVTGPGTGTSDSVAARLSAGEYVVRAAAVAQPGALGLLEALNSGFTHLHPMAYPRYHFAAGGLVEDRAASTSPKLDGNLILGLEDGLVLRALESPEGQRIIVRSLAKNRRAAGRALAGQ